MKHLAAIILACFATNSLVSQEDCQFHSLQKETTPLGKTLEYKLINDSIYHVFWGIGTDLKELKVDFYCNAPPVVRPSLYFESQDYLFLSSGCGSACRIGYLLPIDNSESLVIIPNYFHVDLENEVIIGLDSFIEGFIEIFDLEKNTKINIEVPISCHYAMPYDCLEKASINSDSLTIIWDSQLKEKPLKVKIRN